MTEKRLRLCAGRGGFAVVTVPIELGFVDGVATSHDNPLSDTMRIAWTVLRTRFGW